ncbi:hypothetical protein BBJ28_00012503 [Nothophytophthora sp. Chile5]|nr:hypothetical protein BBJ28_00012503 [Nothophytophthora sp. Chile5]
MDRAKNRRKGATAVASNCFRLLRLTHELQNDGRVMKTVVDEVDVLRLCRSLGMAVSTEAGSKSAREFEFGLFDPSDYDADFARFLREKVFGGSDSQQEELEGGQDLLQIGCLFGKQPGVKAELARMGFWSAELNNNLSLEDQGLNATLFEPDVIRDAPAYTLRFLVSLSPSVTYCLSREDFRCIENEVQAASSSAGKRWDSYSFAFSVQKQEKQSDNIYCGPPVTASLPLGEYARDIFLSVLNASVSMLTIFRMESRFDKDLDALFSRFQKGVQLIKNNPQLFRGLLYMSVKDVNVNDQQGVVDELVTKLDGIFDANKDQNFLVNMYSGQLEINCSPPLGTTEYYQSQEHAAKTLHDILAPGGEAARGFPTGKAFLACLRIVLAKISILDWTNMDKSTQKLLVADVKQRLPGILRTGCHVSVAIVSDTTIPSHLKEEVVRVGTRAKVVIPLSELCVGYPAFSAQWLALNELVVMDSIADEAVDFGFDVTSLENKNVAAIQNTLVELFGRYLSLRGKAIGNSKLTVEDQSEFDTLLSFVLRRRKMKVSWWLRDMLTARLPEVWAAGATRAGYSGDHHVKDHFHGQTTESRVFTEENGVAQPLDASSVASDSDDAMEDATHMCLGTHRCGALCEVDGICEQKVHLKKSSRTYQGARGSFEYVFQEMNGQKKPCAHVLPSGKQDHEGAGHSCIVECGEEAEETMHYCAAHCPCCDYYCSKDYGHMELHKTSHGNMRQTFFVARSSDIDLEDRKYQVGERGTAEMCNLYCSKMGRGHIHYLKCNQGTAESCVYTGDASQDQRRHCTDELYPPPGKAMDELLHAQFWSTIGWEDPCVSEEEREVFAKCPYQCNAAEHEEGPDKRPSYCVLNVWHPPAVKPGLGDDGFAYVSGHKFECVHATDSGKFHHIFVPDNSGSMSGQPWQDLLCACSEFLMSRLKDEGERDLVSFVTFNHESDIPYEAESLLNVQQLILPPPDGGASFAEGLCAASEVLSQNDFEEFKAVLIFFSDGHPWDIGDGLALAKHISTNYAKFDLKTFVVGFGLAVRCSTEWRASWAASIATCWTPVSSEMNSSESLGGNQASLMFVEGFCACKMPRGLRPATSVSVRMPGAFLPLLLLLSVLATGVVGDYGPKDAVVVLTEKNFEKEVLQSPDYWLVEFYAPCGSEFIYYMRQQPIWWRVWLGLQARLGVVDATEHQALAQKYQIKGYPTIKEFGAKKKKPRDYQGGRTKKDIIQYVKSSEEAKKLGVGGAAVSTLEFANVHTFLTQSELPSAIFFGRPKPGKKSGGKAPSWLSAVAESFTEGKKKKKHPTVQLAFVPGSDDKIAKHFGLSDDQLPAVVFVYVASQKFVVSDVSPLNEAAAKTFISEALANVETAASDETLSSVPLFPSPEVAKKKPSVTLKELDAQSAHDCVTQRGKMCVVVAKDDGEVVRSLAKKYRRDPFTFLSSATDAPAFQALTQFIGQAEGVSQPEVIVVKPGRKTKYSGSTDEGGISEFLDKLLDGSSPFSVPQGDLKTLEAALGGPTDDAAKHEEL